MIKSVQSASEFASGQSIWGSRKDYLYDIVNTCRLGEGQSEMPPKITALGTNSDVCMCNRYVEVGMSMWENRVKQLIAT